MRTLARRLLVVNKISSDPEGHEAAVLIEKLRLALSKVAGGEGFASLLRRALTLAAAEVPSLRNLTVGAEGRLEGFTHLAATDGSDAAGEAEVAIAAHLLELLVTFIGKPLTLRLVHTTWPEPTREK